MTMSSFKRSKIKSKESKHANLKLSGKSRKQLRMEIRKQKKIDKVLYLKKRYESRTRANIHFHEATDSDNGKSCDKTAFETVNVENRSQENAKNNGKIEFKRKENKAKLLKEANLKEDKVIKKLEKQLKLKKKKKKTIPKSFKADGLDYLLDFCLEENRECMVTSEKDFIDEEFDPVVLQTLEENVCKNNKISNNEKKESEHENGNNNEIQNNCSVTIKAEKQPNSNKNLPKTARADLPNVNLEKSREHGNTAVNNKALWEDIYGRKRDKDGNIVHSINKYIPPGARIVMHRTNEDDEKLKLLRKQFKGCLNRVTEQNIHYITNQIEAMYTTNSRSNVNFVLSELIFESLILPVITPERLICEQMMLIAILHANIGIEVGASFLERLVKKLVTQMEMEQDVENKELDNIVLMISHLYNFGVFGHKLLYQILERLMMKFMEKEIELILLILKTVGFSLRKDDPNKLKEFIQNLQLKAREETERSLRVKFMLDVLLAIKNNNINKIPQCDSSHVEHLKKVMKNVVRKGNVITQFNVSLEDLLHADEIGKWWIVGSAWSGSNNASSKTEIRKQNKISFGNEILELARKQRMNTDARKNIFCILMTAEDYLDAFEKLQHLGLKDQQEGEIIHVLMHCCMHENKFNPYYAVLAKNLCEHNRKYQLTIQYTLWDKLKTLKIYGSKQLSNMAQFLSYLLIERALALSIFKVIHFTELDKHTMKFLRQIVMGILLHENEQACLQVFERVSTSAQLSSFRESFRLFINCFVVQNLNAYNIPEEQKIMLRKRVDLVDKTLISHGAKFVF